MPNNAQSIHIKKDILVRIAKAFFSADFKNEVNKIPVSMRPRGFEAPYRCCLHKERAIIRDRIIAFLGFSMEKDDEIKALSDYAAESLMREKPDNEILTVLEDACRGCVPSKIYVTDLCKGCVARPCEKTCKFGAITVKDGKSHIDASKCRGCKMCISACPYNAIVKLAVPCEDACPVSAIAKNEKGLAVINYDECISCGRCIAACPFGSIHEKSQIIDVMRKIKSDKKVIAMTAPAIAGQFDCSFAKLKTAVLKCGFDEVIEVAQGADITTKNEAAEFEERMSAGAPFMTTSCCAAYNELVKKHLPQLKPFVSETKTPLYYTAEPARKKNPDAVLVFISPCAAKRREVLDNPAIDYTLNTEELSALIEGRDIDINGCEESIIENPPSKQGRAYAVTGAVSGAVKHASKNPDIMKPHIISGLNKDAIKDLKQFAKNACCPGCNIIEVMACEGGCLGGSANIKNEKAAKKNIENLLKSSSDLV